MPSAREATAVLLALAPFLSTPAKEERIEDNSLVWGLALPVGAGPSSGQRSLMLYLSFEHPLLGS